MPVRIVKRIWSSFDFDSRRSGRSLNKAVQQFVRRERVRRTSEWLLSETVYISCEWEGSKRPNCHSSARVRGMGYRSVKQALQY